MTVELRKNKRKEVVLKRRNVPAIDSTDSDDDTHIVSIDLTVCFAYSHQLNMQSFRARHKTLKD